MSLQDEELVKEDHWLVKSYRDSCCEEGGCVPCSAGCIVAESCEPLSPVNGVVEC